MTNTKKLIEDLIVICIKKQVWFEYRPASEYFYYIDDKTFIQLDIRSVDRNLLLAIEKVKVKEDAFSLVF